jgi:spore maturation protein CgeB
MKWDYGDPKRGLSFEHTNFYDCLVHMGHEVSHFDFMALLREHGRDRMNQMMEQRVCSEKPELLFCILYGDELDMGTMRRITESGVTTFNWFCDDHWRFQNFSRRWAPCFKWVSTTDSRAVTQYHRLGYHNVLKTQWACNHFSYRKLSLPLKYDVTFVGQAHGNRRSVIKKLQKAGIAVSVWGEGWPNGRLSQQEMIAVFNQSRINLNLSNAYRRGKLFAFGHRRDQIKGRNFEIPGCGGFQLSGAADNLEEYFRPSEEIAIFRDTDELVDKIRYYLNREAERARIAQAGYERTRREHTYEKRFNELFAAMGLQ